MKHVVVVGRLRTWRTAVPSTRLERMRGLLGRACLPSDQALLLPRSRSIHTVGMRFAIAVAWLDASARVIAVRRVSPGRVALPRRGACAVLECAAGAGPLVGERLSVEAGEWSEVSGPQPSWGRNDGQDHGGSTRGTRSQHARVQEASAAPGHT